MRLVVTGREGQVVRSLVERGEGLGIEVVPVGRPELDLAADADSIIRAVERTRPDVLVSAAAYTAVDLAESEPELAFTVNARGPAAVAKAARNLGVPLVHLSTDYVFDGTKASPYAEDDPVGPASIYGASKLAGEEAVLAGHDNAAILRTAWVYSPFGRNFLRTMLQLAETRDEVGVVADQVGNPTSALGIADGILRVAGNLAEDANPNQRGIFHMTAAGEASWAEFAEAIFDASAAAGGPSATVRHIATADFPTAARRPANSRLDSTKLAEAHGVRLADWRLSTAEVVGRLLQPVT